ncbi:MAG: KEOPS complex kinase/ATPase Bud32, partial [Candidatus Bathyarchaeia archaeon]
MTSRGAEVSRGMMLVRRGAEADLYLGEWYGRSVIVKKRIPKGYRNPHLDSSIRRSRTAREAQLIHDARLAGVPTPLVYVVDMADTTIIMEYVEGRRVKEVLETASSKERTGLCRRLGVSIGHLHRVGVIHGDLTTSNMIVAGDGRVYFVDFGLGVHSGELEDRGVDLLLLRRALQSTHHRYARRCFDTVVEGYSEVMGG